MEHDPDILGEAALAIEPVGVSAPSNPPKVDQSGRVHRLIPPYRRTISVHGSLHRAVGYCELLGGSDNPDPEILEEILDDASEPTQGANIITSLLRAGDMHLPVLDLDFPAQLWPSTTPGHFHLILDRWVDQDTYFRLLDVMADAGLIERGYAESSKARGYSSVRAPWVRK